MLLRCKCPKCGDNKEYVAELVGTETDCFRCGHRFALQGNPGRVTWQIVSATLAVLLMIGAIGARYYLRANRWNWTHDRAAHTTTHRSTVSSVDTEDDDR